MRAVEQAARWRRRERRPLIERRFGPYGGRYVPETLIPALDELERGVGRGALGPGVPGRAGRAAARLRRPPDAALPRRAAVRAEVGHDVWLKREDLLHTGSHKINNALGQSLLAQRMGKPRLIAETGAGQHGVRHGDGGALLGPRVRRLHGHRGHPPPAARTCSG